MWPYFVQIRQHLWGVVYLVNSFLNWVLVYKFLICVFINCELLAFINLLTLAFYKLQFSKGYTTGASNIKAFGNGRSNYNMVFNSDRALASV